MQSANEFCNDRGQVLGETAIEYHSGWIFATLNLRQKGLERASFKLSASRQTKR